MGVGEAGAAALVHACRTDQFDAVRQQASHSINLLQLSCTASLSNMGLHVFVRGRSALVLSRLSELISKAAIEALVVGMLSAEDVYLRRRISEAFCKLGVAAGELGFAALSHAASRDSDVYVQWQASQALEECRSPDTQVTTK